MHKKIKILKHLSLFIPIIFTFLFLEIFFRYSKLTPELSEYKMFSPDSTLPYVGKPNAFIAGINPTNEFKYHYKHNSLGFRDREHNLINDSAKIILGLGDSFLYGAGVSMDSSILETTEEILSKSFSVEVYKHGLSRYYPELYKIYFKTKGYKLNPDLLVISVLPNDIKDTYIGSEKIKVNKDGYMVSFSSGIFGEITTNLYLKSHFFRFVIHRISKLMDSINTPKTYEIFIANGSYENAWLNFERDLKDISDFAISKDVELLILAIPQALTLSWLQKKASPWEKEQDYFFKRVSKFCKNHDIKFLSAKEGLTIAKEKKIRLYYPKDGHCTPIAYRLIGESLSDYILNTHPDWLKDK